MSDFQKKTNESNELSLAREGESLGDYVILRRLGSGGMANVFLAEQTSLKRKVALKIMKAELTGDTTYVSRFIREAQSAAALVQANIVQVYEVGEKNGQHFIAQEYVAGKNLKQYLNRHGALEVVMAVNVMRQVGLALQKASEQDVIHRDIKPENIMLSPNGEVKVADFGLARVVNKNSKLDLTQIGIAMGTPLYMSPEQIEGKDVDPRSDLYSLGVTAFHMLAGYPPFEGETALAVALQHINQSPPDLSKTRPDVPKELCLLINRLLAKKPEDRIESAAEFLRELRKIPIPEHQDWESLALKLAETRGFSERTAIGHLAATRELQTILQGNGRQRIHWKMLVPMMFMTAFGIGIGLVAAWLQPMPTIYSKESKEIVVEKKPTVEEQYRTAFWSNKPDDYRAVLEFFPAESDDIKTKFYHWNTMKNLGFILVQSKKLDDLWEARRYFNTLLSDSKLDTFPDFQAAGWAGLAFFNDEMYRETGDTQYLEQTREMLENLDDPIYFNLLDKIFQQRVLQLMDNYNSIYSGPSNARRSLLRPLSMS